MTDNATQPNCRNVLNKGSLTLGSEGWAVNGIELAQIQYESGQLPLHHSAPQNGDGYAKLFWVYEIYFLTLLSPIRFHVISGEQRLREYKWLLNRQSKPTLRQFVIIAYVIEAISLMTMIFSFLEIFSDTHLLMKQLI